MTTVSYSVEWNEITPVGTRPMSHFCDSFEEALGLYFDMVSKYVGEQRKHRLRIEETTIIKTVLKGGE
jgi:hypothetical protein